MVLISFYHWQHTALTVFYLCFCPLGRGHHVGRQAGSKAASTSVERHLDHYSTQTSLDAAATVTPTKQITITIKPSEGKSDDITKQEYQ